MQNLVRLFRLLLKFLHRRPSTPTEFLLLNKIQVSPRSMVKSRRFCLLCVSAHKDLCHILHFHRLPLTKEKKIVPPLPSFSAGIVTKPLSLPGWGDDGHSCACTHSGLTSKARNRWTGVWTRVPPEVPSDPNHPVTWNMPQRGRKRSKLTKWGEATVEWNSRSRWSCHWDIHSLLCPCTSSIFSKHWKKRTYYF